LTRSVDRTSLSLVPRLWFESWVLPRIEALDPVRDHQEIVRLSARVDFPFDTTRALELALFRTFGVPGISRLLHRTGEFHRAAQKRYDDTDIIVSELTEHGYDSERGRAALRKMNQLHGRFEIPNDQFLYVLSTFIFEPIRWNARFGWRRLTEKEKLAWFHFWREIGHRMGIRDIPESAEGFERFNVDYERREFMYAESNCAVAEATINMFCAWFPRPLRPLVRQSMIALMDEPLRKAMGFSQPAKWIELSVLVGLRGRTIGLKIIPRRRRPLLRTAMRQRSYPRRYAIQDLGPEPGV
jgi:hypothetical protein